MKRLLIIVFLLASAHQAYSMKRAVRFPMNSAKSLITKQFTSRNYGEALTLAETFKDVAKKTFFNGSEKDIMRQQLDADIYATNDQIVKDMFSPIRNNSWWLLPVSTALLTSTQDPILLGLGTIGLTFGSLGFKKQCDYFANKLKYKKLIKNAEKFNTIFYAKEKELKIK